jgi:hypothetical protein
MCDSPAQSEALGLVLRVKIMQPEEYSHLEASWFTLLCRGVFDTLAF